MAGRAQCSVKNLRRMHARSTCRAPGTRLYQSEMRSSMITLTHSTSDIFLSTTLYTVMEIFARAPDNLGGRLGVSSTS